MTVQKPGRPWSEEPREALTKITFKVDDETLQALKDLEAAAGANIRGRRSVVLRQLILDARRRTKK